MKKKYFGKRKVVVRFSSLVIAGMCSFVATPTLAYDRIVSATGNASEVIFEMGLADKLVAVDTTSKIPKDVMDGKPKVGYRRFLSAEGVLSMQPDLLILAPDAGPKTVVEQIRATGVKTITIKDEKSIDGVVADIEMLAQTLEKETEGKELIAKIRKEEEDVKKLITEYPRKPKIVFLMDGGVGLNKLVALGDKTAGNAMIGIVGGENVFAAQFSSIKPVSNEAMIATDMDMIVIAAHGKKVKLSDKIEKVISGYENLALTKAAKKDCVFRIGTVESLGFGPGVTDAAKLIAEQVKACVSDNK